MAATVVSENEAAWIFETGATPVLRMKQKAPSGFAGRGERF
jgi:hypothetical protein